MGRLSNRVENKSSKKDRYISFVLPNIECEKSISHQLTILKKTLNRSKRAWHIIIRNSLNLSQIKNSCSSTYLLNSMNLTYTRVAKYTSEQKNINTKDGSCACAQQFLYSSLPFVFVRRTVNYGLVIKYF